MTHYRRLTAIGTLIGLLLTMTLVAPAAAQEAANSGPTVDPCAELRAANTIDNDDNGMAVDSSAANNATSDQSMSDVASNTDTTQASGQPCPGTGATNAGPALPDWVALDPGETHWYKFRYVYDEDQDSEPSNAIAILDMRQAECIAFDVYTRDMLDFPLDDDGNVRGPVGRGTPFSPGGDDDEVKDSTQLDWVGSSTSSETYFIIVRNRNENVCSYHLTLSGASVRYN